MELNKYSNVIGERMSFLEGKEKSKLTWRAGKLTRGSRSGHHYRWVAKYREPIMDPTGVINTL